MSHNPLSERIAIRFGATLLANLLRGSLSVASGLLIARGMGAAQYGDLNFLLGSFAAINQLLEMGTSSAFYSFISRRPRGPAVFLLYFGWLIVQFTATVLAVSLLAPVGMIDWVWVGQKREIVLLAFGASFLMTQTWGVLSQLGEARRKTVLIQTAAVLQSAIHLALIALTMYRGWLAVTAVLWLLVGEYLVLAVILGPRLVKANLVSQSQSGDDTRSAFREFSTYCTPLIVYAWVGFLYAFADKWSLQRFGGADQQGFFAVGQQFANISLIGTMSILKVFGKEISEAGEQQNHQRVHLLYKSTSRSLYFIGAWISCLLIPYSREILVWTVGSSYETAWLCLALMFLYPVHQSLGQINGALFYASGKTEAWARIGLVMMGISIIATYLMLAPAPLGGLGLGAIGLAIKMVALNVISVNVQGRVLAHAYGWVNESRYQWLMLLPLLIMGFSSKWLTVTLLDSVHPGGGPLEAMLLGVAVYSGLSLALFYRLRRSVGLPYEEVMAAVGGVMRRV